MASRAWTLPCSVVVARTCLSCVHNAALAGCVCIWRSAAGAPAMICRRDCHVWAAPDTQRTARTNNDHRAWQSPRPGTLANASQGGRRQGRTRLCTLERLVACQQARDFLMAPYQLMVAAAMSNDVMLWAPGASASGEAERNQPRGCPQGRSRGGTGNPGVYAEGEPPQQNSRHRAQRRMDWERGKTIPMFIPNK